MSSFSPIIPTPGVRLASQRIKPVTKELNFSESAPLKLDAVKREYDFEHLKDRLYIHWDLLTKCNFHCSYCYSIKDYEQSGQWNKIDNFENQRLIIDAISLAKYPVFLGLLGGEPTLHPGLLEILDLIKNKILPKNKDNRLYITTNGSTNIFKKIQYIPNVFFLWSIHLEFKDRYGKNFSKIFDNIKMMRDRGFKNRVNFMLVPDPKYYEDLHFIYNELLKLNVQIHPHFLYKNQLENAELYDYPKEFFDEFKDFKDVKGNFIYETDDGYYNLNDYYIFKYKLNNFKGWKCYNNNFEISYNGIVQNLCKKEQINILKDPLYFRKIKLDYIKCPYNQCVCDGLLKIYKAKNGTI